MERGNRLPAGRGSVPFFTAYGQDGGVKLQLDAILRGQDRANGARQSGAGPGFYLAGGPGGVKGGGEELGGGPGGVKGGADGGGPGGVKGGAVTGGVVGGGPGGVKGGAVGGGPGGVNVTGEIVLEDG